MACMDEKLSPSHLIVLKDIRAHIDFLSDQQQALEIQILSSIKVNKNYEGLMVRKNASRWLHKLQESGYLEQVQQQA